MSIDAPTESAGGAPRRVSGPYTAHVEALLKQKKSKSKLGRKLKSASDHAVVVYGTVGPILQTAINGVPWFGPAASAVVQLLNRAIDTGDFRSEVGSLAVDVAALLDEIYASLKRCDSSGPVLLEGKALVDDKLFKPITQILIDVIVLLVRLHAVMRHHEHECIGRGWLDRFFHLNDLQERIQTYRNNLPTISDIANVEGHLITGKGIDTVNHNLERVHDKIDSIHAALSSTTNTADYAPLPPPPIPPVLIGRDEELDDVISALLDDQDIAIVGAGGIGKSSLALAVLENDRIKEHYPHRFFVRLDKARTEGAAVAELHRMCPGYAHKARHPLDTLQMFLKELPAQTLLILDNFETFFDHSLDEAEDLLKRLSRIKTVTLLITTRNGALRIDETRPLRITALGSLPAQSAYELFVRTAPRHDNPQTRDSREFQALLKDLDGHSLSIVLIARQANQDTDIRRICTRWQKEKTSVAVQRSAAPTNLTSLEVSIKLSMESPIMNDAARLLLSILAIFPDGLSEDIALSLPSLGASDETVESLLDRLLVTSLASTQPARDSPTFAYRLLVPIKEYINKWFPRLADDVLESLLSWVDNAALDRDHARKTMDYVLRGTPTPTQLTKLVDVAWQLGMARKAMHSSFQGVDRAYIRTLSELCSGSESERNLAACRMLQAASGADRDAWDSYFSTFVELGDVRKQAECLMLRGMSLVPPLPRHGLDFLSSRPAIQALEKALEISRNDPAATSITAECLLHLSSLYSRQVKGVHEYTRRAIQYSRECVALLRPGHPRKLAWGLRNFAGAHMACSDTLPLAQAEYDELIQLEFPFESLSDKKDLMWGLTHYHALSDNPDDWERAARYADWDADLHRVQTWTTEVGATSLAEELFKCPSAACRRVALQHSEALIKNGAYSPERMLSAYVVLGLLYEVYPEEMGVSPGSGLGHLTAVLEHFTDYEGDNIKRGNMSLLELSKRQSAGRVSHIAYWVGCAQLRIEDRDSARATFLWMVEETSHLAGTPHYFRAHLRLAADARLNGDIKTARRHIEQSIESLPDLKRHFGDETFDNHAFKTDALMSAHARYEFGMVLVRQDDLDGAEVQLRAAEGLLEAIAAVSTPKLEVPKRLSGFPEGDIILPPMTSVVVLKALFQVLMRNMFRRFTDCEVEFKDPV